MKNKLIIITPILLNILTIPNNQALNDEKTIIRTVNGLQGRIYKGSIAKEGQFPWQVIYWYEEEGISYCGGALISPEFVLTAAHCVNNYRPKPPVALHLGTITRTDSPAIRITDGLEVISHGDYQSKTFLNDIALIKLPYAVAFSSIIQAISLSNNQLCPDETVITSGWGKDGNLREGTKLLHYVTLKTISNGECRIMYPPNVNRGVVCTLGIVGQFGATCSGDSGSGLVKDVSGFMVLVGIVSYGNSQGCESNYAMGFTRIAYFEAWIKENVKDARWVGTGTKCLQSRCSFSWPFQFLCWFL